MRRIALRASALLVGVAFVMGARVTLARASEIRDPGLSAFHVPAQSEATCSFGIGAPREGEADRSPWLIAADIPIGSPGNRDLPTLLRGSDKERSRTAALERCAAVLGWPADLQLLGPDTAWFNSSYDPLPQGPPGRTGDAPRIWMRTS